jgi:hypothetical protein
VPCPGRFRAIAGNPAFPATTQPRATRGGSPRALTQDQPMAGFGLTLAAPLPRGEGGEVAQHAECSPDRQSSPAGRRPAHCVRLRQRLASQGNRPACCGPSASLTYSTSAAISTARGAEMLLPISFGLFGVFGPMFGFKIVRRSLPPAEVSAAERRFGWLDVVASSGFAGRSPQFEVHRHGGIIRRTPG